MDKGTEQILVICASPPFLIPTYLVWIEMRFYLKIKSKTNFLDMKFRCYHYQ